MGIDDWKIGTMLIAETSFGFFRRKIVRETPTMWVFDNGNKIKKGQRPRVGDNGYGTPHFYSVDEPEGKEITKRLVKAKKVSAIQRVIWSNVSEKVLNAVYAIVDGKDTKSDRRNKMVRCIKNAKIARLKAESYDGLECEKPDYDKQAETWLDAAERVRKGE